MQLVDFLLFSKKAVVAFVLAAAGWLLAKVGADVDVSVREALEALVSGGITFAGVWFANNRK